MAKKHTVKRGNAMTVIILCLAAALATIRVVYAPSLAKDTESAYWANLWVAALLAVVLVITLVLALFLKPYRVSKKVSIWPLAITAGLLGIIMIVTGGYDAVMWIAHGKAPAPSETILNMTDAIVLVLSILSGIASGIYFIRLMLVWIAEERCYRGIFRIGALMPVCWIWLRIVRYELAHIALIDMQFSIHDFAMLVCSMLFLFRIACLCTNIGKRKTPPTLFCTAATAICALSSSAVRLCLYLNGDAELYQSAPLANGIDFCIGLYALAWVLYLWNDGLSLYKQRARKTVHFLKESDNKPYQPPHFFIEPKTPTSKTEGETLTADDLLMDIILPHNDDSHHS